jgi:hypothetical protein
MVQITMVLKNIHRKHEFGTDRLSMFNGKKWKQNFMISVCIYIYVHVCVDYNPLSDIVFNPN